MNKEFWKATGIRCLRTFISTIMGVWTADKLITEIDWKVTLLAAVSTTVYIFLACVLAGLPEVELAKHIYMDAEEPLDSFTLYNEEKEEEVKEEVDEDGEE